MEKISQLRWLLVEKLTLFSQKEYRELEEKASLELRLSGSESEFLVIVTYFAEPLPAELFKLFNLSERRFSVYLKLNYLYNTHSLYQLIFSWFSSFSPIERLEKDFKHIFRESQLCFEFPQIILKLENRVHEDFFKEQFKYLTPFLEFLFGHQQIFLEIVKVEESIPSFLPPLDNLDSPLDFSLPKVSENLPDKPKVSVDKAESLSITPSDTRESIVKGKFKLYFLEKLDSYALKNQNIYKLGFTSFKEHYFVILGRQVSILKRDEYAEIFKLESWYEIELKLEQKGSSRTLFNYDGWLLKCEPAEAPEEVQIIESSERRIFPLNVYTKYSVFDGLFSADEWAEFFSSLGYKVLPLTDFNNVHVFPEGEKSAKKYNLKPLYGSEIEVVSEDLQIISNLHLLESESTIIYSIFDLETTGLNPTFDEIIEIYICKYAGGVEIDSYHSLLKCEKPLTKEIVDLTNITDEKLDILGRDKVQVLKEVKDYVAGTVLMAHNGLDFDLPFLNAQFIKAGLEPLEAPILDTMLLAKALEGEKKSKSFSLQALSKKMSLHVVERELHSADYDTKCLIRLWKLWEKELMTKYSLDPYIYENLESLNSLCSQEKLYKNYFGSNIIFFVKNQAGLEALYQLISKAHIENFVEKPKLTWESIKPLRNDLILLSSPTNCSLFKALLKDDFELFKREGKKLDYVSFPPPSHFLHEIQRNFYTREQLEQLLRRFYDWAKKCRFKLVANYCLKYKWYSEIEQYKVLVHAKNVGGRRHHLFSAKYTNDILPDYSFRSSEKFISEYDFLKLSKKEKENLFFKYRDEIESLISSEIEVSYAKLALPKLPGALENIREYIAQKIRSKYGPKPNTFLSTTLNKELLGIQENGYESVYWCSHLLVQRSKAEGFLVGSRGSVGSSFLAYILEISEVNPLPPHYFCSKCSFFLLDESFRESGFDLEPKNCPNCKSTLSTDGQNIPFETFLGLERNKVPDIDLNFSGQYQQKAHNFLRELFGRERTFRTGTISAVADKTAFALAKNYLTDNGLEFNKGRIHWLSFRLTNIKRTTGQHPGGIIVIPEGDSVYRYTPVNYPANDTTSDWLTTHFEKEALKDSLFKFDILGQDDPTILALLSKFTGQNLEKIGYDDKKILKMFSDISILEIPKEKLDILGESVGTLGLPEFGTEKTREILKACKDKLNHFSDLIRISGISHGKNVWKNNIERLISHHNLSLGEVITCRDDIMNYLLEKKIGIERAFKIAESVRRGYGIPAEFLPLLRDAGVPQWYIECANKITYIFPKAHATAYVLMCWKIAFFKLYYPVEFYAAYLTITNKHFDIEGLITNDLKEIKRRYQDCKALVKNRSNKDNIEKTKYLVTIYEVALEMLSRGIKFKMVELNESLASTFKPDSLERTVLLPFSSISGLGLITATQLEEERNKKGKYLDREDLENRVKLNVTMFKLFEKLGIISQKS